MVTNNKVLTVSYGTFSCTLEGFDNSFDTMKAIAEYFRDLAADDRYFGAEPPTPDAEMLARIAEREIARRVSARTEEGAIYLSAAAQQAEEQPEPAETKAEEPVPTEAAPAVAEVAQDVTPEPELEPEIEDVTDEILQAVQRDEEESVSPEEETAADAAPFVLEDQIETAAESAVAKAEETVVEDSFESDDDVEAEVEETPFTEDEAEVDEAPYAEAEIFEPEAAIEPEDDSIAAKLQRIRAVVSKSEQEPEDDSFSEDEHAESFLSDTRREIESVLRLDDEMAAAANADDVESLADKDDAAMADSTVKPVRARVLRMKKSDFEAAVADGLLEAEPDEDDAEEAFDDGAPDHDANVAQPASSLSPEDEAELLAELAQVEAELNRNDAQAEAEADAATMPIEPAPAEAEAPVAAKRARALAETGDDMSRLLRETDSQLEEPEGNRRRQAIAHLRAAVAATKAEKSASDAKPDTDQTEAYREDLASVVRGAPRTESGGTAKPSRPAAAPLKLVAAQRIDSPSMETPERAPEAAEPQDTSRVPVRPRRVSAADRQEAAAKPQETPVGDGESFADFAEAMGATRLPDVLEAAAAYLTYVEGRDKFSRPMVMRMARDVNEEDFSREDTLRTFGQLLRENKIAKLSGGRFTASDNIAFKPEDRAAG